MAYCVSNDIVTLAVRRLNASTPDNQWEGRELDIAACLTNALERLGDKVMWDDAKRGLLQQDYTVTLSSGVGDLLAATGSITGDADILTNGVYWGVVKDADGNILQPLKNYSAFLRPQPLIYDYYCLKGQHIHTRSKLQQVNLPSDVTSVTGPLTITANFEPATAEDVPSELQDDLVTILCEIVLTKLQPNGTTRV